MTTVIIAGGVRVRLRGWGAFSTIDATTAQNGVAEILAGSHLWPEDEIDGGVGLEDFIKGNAREHDTGARGDVRKVILPAGSLMPARGTLWHRRGANRPAQKRLRITPQYCPGWTRRFENMAIGVSPKTVKILPKGAWELLGCSVHPPFMGHVDGRHPDHMMGIWDKT